MLRAMIQGEKRPPLEKGERGQCPNCGNEVIAVIPIQNIRHWRHRGKDCDPWSEPEGEWHLAWKERFDPDWTEVSMDDATTGERHRADIFCPLGDQGGTVVELQHSAISEEEQLSRERFYSNGRKFYWLLHIHSEKSFRGYHFRLSLNFEKIMPCKGQNFSVMTWFGSTQFIERWKRADAHVFFDFQGHIFYLATPKACSEITKILKKGEFALHRLSVREFMDAVTGK
jgi:hypothetical protein